MNITRILPYFAGCALLMASCANEDLTPDMHQGSGSVKFTLGGSAKKKSTRATVADEDKESNISNVLAVLFDKEAGFYKTVEANGVTNGQYEFNVERDGSYDIYFVANADAALKAKLEGITVGTKITGSDNVLETIIATQDPGADNEFPMFCTTPVSVDKLIVKDEKDLGTITMRRLAARFDIINNAPGITVTGITLKNSAKQSSLAVRNAEGADADASEWYADKRYDASTAGWPADFKCEMTDGAVVPVKFEQTIYSYENLSGTAGFSATNRPVIEVEYLEEDGQTKRTHDVELKEPKSGEILALQRNHLYRITLNYEYDLDFDLTVLDWDDSETFEYPDIPIITEPENPLLSITPEQQQEMNKKLKVYDLFTNIFFARPVNNNVNQISFVYLPDQLTDEKIKTDYSHLSDFLSSTNKQYGKTVKDKDNDSYRLPTKGELELLFPEVDNAIVFDPKIEYNTVTATETVYLQNSTNGTENRNGTSIIGESVFKRGSKLLPTNKNTSAIPVYGIRFKGTDQYSAYRWEVLKIDDEFELLNVRVKALPKDREISIEHIVDNEEFWVNSFVTEQIRYYGWGITDTSGKDIITYKNSSTVIFTSTVDITDTHWWGLTVSKNEIKWDSGIMKEYLSIPKLVKVK